MYNCDEDLFSPSNMIAITNMLCDLPTPCKMTNNIFLWLVPALVLALWCPFTLISYQFCQIFNVSANSIIVQHKQSVISLWWVFFFCFWHWWATDGSITCCACVFCLFSGHPKIVIILLLALMGHWWLHHLVCVCFLPFFRTSQNCHHGGQILTTMMMILGCSSHPSLLKCHRHDGASLLFLLSPLVCSVFAPSPHSHCSHATSRLDFGLFFVEDCYHFLVFCACAMADGLCASCQATTNLALFSFSFLAM